MPVLHIYSPLDSPPPKLLEKLCSGILGILSLPAGHCWAVWHEVAPHNFHRDGWHYGAIQNGPIVTIYCKRTYGKEEISRMLLFARDTLADGLSCNAADVYATVQRVQPGETLVRGEIWQEVRGGGVTEQDVLIRPVAIIRSPRMTPEDDYWRNVESYIDFDARQFGPDVLLGLSEFSHIEAIFLMHQVAPESVERGARRPRERMDWPLVGIFAQRAKSRPNRMGVSRCELLEVSGHTLHVRGLDAIDGTPVIDVKPYMEEFGPRGPIRQPAWSNEVMKDYY